MENVMDKTTKNYAEKREIAVCVNSFDGETYINVYASDFENEIWSDVLYPIYEYTLSGYTNISKGYTSKSYIVV